MKKNSYIIDCIVKTFITIVLGIIGWTGFYLASEYIFSESYFLNLPHNKLLILDFSGDLSSTDKAYRISGTIRSTPRALHSGISYHCLFDSLKIADASDRTIIAFSRSIDNTYTYRTDMQWSDEERLNIFNAFAIDISNTASSDDMSLLQQPYDIFIGKDGRITEFSFPLILRSALSSSIRNSRASIILEELFDRPYTLPPIFPLKLSNRSWKTSGTFIEPITFTNTIEEDKSNDNIITIHTVASRRQDASPSLSSTNSGLLAMYEEKISRHTWDAVWTYDLASQTIQSMKISFAMTISSEFPRKATPLSYTCNIAIKSTFIDIPFPINEAPSYTKANSEIDFDTSLL